MSIEQRGSCGTDTEEQDDGNSKDTREWMGGGALLQNNQIQIKSIFSYKKRAMANRVRKNIFR